VLLHNNRALGWRS